MLHINKAGTSRLPDVNEVKDDTDQVIDQVLAELRMEDGIMDEINEEVLKDRKRRRIKKFLIGLGIVALAATVFCLLYFRTYTKARISTSYELSDSGNENYREFAGGVLRYSKDGIALVNRKGDEEWNQSYQIRNPIISTCEDEAAVVADKGANSIVVLGRDGLKGELETTLPVEKVAVSGQGIVCAVLRSGSSPKIICYDTAGNVLVEMTTSLTGTGYPMDVSLSKDGTKLLASFLCTADGKLVTKVRFYDFSEVRDTSGEYEVLAEDYPDILAAAAFFEDNGSAVVADDRVIFYSGGDLPEQVQTVVLTKKIKSVFHGEGYVGLVLKNEGKGGCELCLFNMSGKQVLSEEFLGDYSHAKISGHRIFLYDGRKCLIYTLTGRLRFEGEMENSIMEIFPVIGINKYIALRAGSMDVIRLVQ